MADNHPEYRLGRRHPDPERAARSLRIGDYLTFRRRGLTPPSSADHLSRVQDWGLYLNNQFGICGPTAAANSRKLITLYLTGTEVSPAQEAVNALYALENPGFDPATSEPGGPQDQGVDLQVMCDNLVKNGLGDVKALGHASVDATNLDEVRECVTLFGFVILGVNLETAQQNQMAINTPPQWSFDPSTEWGGHAVMCGGFDGDTLDDVSWAQVVEQLQSFSQHQLEEARVVIWPEHLGLRQFTEGVDLQQLAADYQQLTGRIFPVSVDPTPTPSPSPEPAPAPAPAGPSLVDQFRGDIEDLFGKVRAAVKSEAGPVDETVKQDAAQLVSSIRQHVEEFAQKHGL